jgi:acyl carrier protein
MKEQLLLDDFAQLLNIPEDSINKSVHLSKHPYWDSIAMLSIMGAIDSHYGIVISGVELMKAAYVQDIFNIINNKLKDTA